MAKLARWVWQRISDWYTTLDILEWLGWKNAVATIVVSAIAGITTFLNDAPGHYVFMACRGSALFVLGLVVACQNYWLHKSTTDITGDQSPIKFDFPDEWSCSEFVMERARVGTDMLSRKMVWVNIKNESDHDVRNVRAEIGDFRTVTDAGAEEIHPVVANKTFPLQFHRNTTVLNFSPHMNAVFI
jgi:hypothetical protein